MKYVSRFFVILSVFAAFQAQAGTGSLVCSNGDIETVGDAFYQITVLEDGIEFSPYESGYSVDAADVIVKDNTLTITNKTVTRSSEGEEENIKLNAVLVFSANYTKLSAAVSENDGPFQSYELNCLQK